MTKTTIIQQKATGLTEYVASQVGSVESLNSQRFRQKLMHTLENAAAYFPDAMEEGNTDELQECVLKAAKLGVLPNKEDGVIIMVRDTKKKRKVPSFWITTTGARKRMAENKLLVNFSIEMIRAKDKYDFRPLSSEPPKLVLGGQYGFDSERGDIIGVVAVAHLQTGGYIKLHFNIAEARERFVPNWVRKAISDPKSNYHEKAKGHYSQMPETLEPFLRNAATKALFRRIPLDSPDLDTRDISNLITDSPETASIEAQDIPAQETGGAGDKSDMPDLD